MSHPKTLAAGRYLLVAPLGEGGMATVYRAYDQRLQVWRAIKILAAEYARQARTRQRFEAEAQTMALLEHPSIVRVYDTGTEGESAYIVMELIEGGSLVDWVERHGPMPPRLAVDVTVEVCEALAAAHAKGVVHRDIKPHNVLIARDGRCRVTDFGIAMVSTSDHNMTRTGAVMGTWGYMSPEQRTNAKGVDVRADVYSCAAMLYTLLTHQIPMDLFAADRDAEMLAGIPAPLVPALVRATEYKREDRFPTCPAFAEALRAVRDQLAESPAATPPLLRDPGAPPPPPRPEDFPALSAETAVPEAPSRDSLTMATLAPSEKGVFAPTMAPEPPPLPPSLNAATTAPEAGGGSWRWMLAAAWAVAALVVVAGVLLVGVAGALYVANDDGVAVAVTPPVDDPLPEPASASGDPAPRPTPAADPAPPAAPATPGAPKPDKPPAPRIEPKPVKAASDVVAPPITPAPPVDPPSVTTVVVPPPASPQCVRANRPAAAAIGADVVLKATLCTPESVEVILNYRAAGTGAWQQKLMPKALGAFTTKIAVDASYASGVEYYVTAGAVSDGSAAAPYLIPVR